MNYNQFNKKEKMLLIQLKFVPRNLVFIQKIVFHTDGVGPEKNSFFLIIEIIIVL